MAILYSALSASVVPALVLASIEQRLPVMFTNELIVSCLVLSIVNDLFYNAMVSFCFQCS